MMSIEKYKYTPCRVLVFRMGGYDRHEQKGKNMGKDFKRNIICKNAICKFEGSAGRETRARLARQQFPKGSTCVSNDDLEPLGCSIENDLTRFKKNREVSYPPIPKKLF